MLLTRHGMEVSMKFDELYAKAKSILNSRKLSATVEAGDVSEAILCGNGKAYTGVCIDAACSLGFCGTCSGVSHDYGR